MAPEITAELLHYGLEGLSVLVGLFVTLQNSKMKMEVLTIRLWITENFVKREEWHNSRAGRAVGHDNV